MKRALVVPTCLLLACSWAIADDVFPPLWQRGMDRTVEAEWDTWDANGFPDVWNAAPPLAESASFTLGAAANVLATYAGRSDVVELTADLDLSFHVPNYLAGDQKTIWLQVTYYDPNGDSEIVPALDVPSGIQWELIPEGAGPASDYRHEHGGGWITRRWILLASPNPEWEEIQLSSVGVEGPVYPAYVDQVVIDTLCIPEPATACLLALGTLRLFTKRRRK